MYKHQRTAKYCLSLQDKDTDIETICECGRKFSRKDAMFRHQRKCAQSPQPSGQIEDKIGDLIDIINKLVERPTPNVSNNNCNNVVMNLPPITDEEIAGHLEHLTINFINSGAKGYADFAGNYPFKNRLVCTDKARKKLRYKDSNGDIVNDACGLKLTQRFFQAIAPRNEELINDEYNTLRQEVQKIASEGTAYNSNLTSILTKATHLQELLAKCQQAAKGEENELTKEFVNHLSRML